MPDWVRQRCSSSTEICPSWGKKQRNTQIQHSNRRTTGARAGLTLPVRQRQRSSHTEGPRERERERAALVTGVGTPERRTGSPAALRSARRHRERRQNKGFHSAVWSALSEIQGEPRQRRGGLSRVCAGLTPSSQKRLPFRETRGAAPASSFLRDEQELWTLHIYDRSLEFNL